VHKLFQAVSHIAHDFTDSEFVLETLDGMLRDSGEKLTRTDKVRDLLFDGVSIQAYVDLVENPLVQQAGSVSLPENFADGLFALFKGVCLFFGFFQSVIPEELLPIHGHDDFVLEKWHKGR